MTFASEDENDIKVKEKTEFICRLLLLTIFLTTPTLGAVVRFWLLVFGIKKEETHG